MVRSKPILILSALAVTAAAASAGAAILFLKSRPRFRLDRPTEPKRRLGDLRVRVKGHTVYARMAHGPANGLSPVVLIHGYGMSSRYMIPLAERLAAERTVYAPDLPGHGRSDLPERALAMDGLVEVLHAWMDVVGVERAVFLGNSMGCQILAELAVRHPERVDRLIFVGPTTDPEARTPLRHLPRLLASGFAERFWPRLVLLVLAEYLRTGFRQLYQEMHIVFGDRIEDKLPRITAPCLVVRGEGDALVPQHWAEEIARGLRAGEVRVVRDAGHAPHYGSADELMRIIRPFLNEKQPVLRLVTRGEGSPSLSER